METIASRLHALSGSGVDNALRSRISPESERQRLGSWLGARVDPKADDVAFAGLTFADLLYDYSRVDPDVVLAADFARTEDLAEVFKFGAFAQRLTALEDAAFMGNVAQIQGYVAERLVAQQLQSMGYEVEFPKTSNQKGFDLLVNDHPVQVKCLNDPGGVREHLERFPDIPVVVNNELSPYFENVDGVYTVPSFSHDDVVNSTKATLDAGSDLLDLEVPLVAAATAAGKNVWGIVRGRTDFVAALENIALDVVGGAAGGTAGAKILGMAGLVLGPYGGVVGGLIGAVLGANQGRRAASWIKGKFLCRDAEAAAGQALARFMSAAASEGWQKAGLLEKKIEILEKNLTSRGPGSRTVWNSHFRQRAEYERRYVRNKAHELEQAAAQPLMLDAGGEDVFRACAEGAMLVIQAGIPPYALALEYRNLADNVARLQHERARYFLQ